MGRSRGWVRGGAGVALGALVLAPAWALPLAAIVDRGPDGAARPTAFHVALTAAQPMVWESARNSLAVAVVASAGSWLLGVGLARMVTRWRFWGRRPLVAIAWAPWTLPPMLGALGLRALVGPAAGSAIAGGPWGWLALGWLELAWGVPRVGLAAAETLATIPTDWEDAARLAGGGRHRAWRRLAWPIVRPAVARAVAEVFTLTLFEPAAPILLGLRRTLAFQAVEAATRPDDLPRAAALASLAWALAATARLLLRWWGGPDLDRTRAPRRRAPARRARWPRATAWTAILLTWAVLALGPPAILAARVLVPGRGGSGWPTVPALAALLGDREAGRLLGRSLALGLVVAFGALLAARIIRSGARARRLADRPRGLPPLAIGIGALALPALLGAWSSSLRSSDLARGFGRLAAVLEPAREPGLLLAWAVGLGQWSGIAAALDRGRARARPVLVEAARAAGASRAQAWRTVTLPLLATALAGPGLLAVVLAAGDSAAALVLTPTSRTLNVGAALVLGADEPGMARRIDALGTVLLAANLAAVILDARGRRLDRPVSS